MMLSAYPRLVFLIKGRKDGKVAVKKTVTRKGSTFQQTFWVSPAEAAALKKQQAATKQAASKKKASAKTTAKKAAPKKAAPKKAAPKKAAPKKAAPKKKSPEKAVAKKKEASKPVPASSDTGQERRISKRARKKGAYVDAEGRIVTPRKESPEKAAPKKAAPKKAAPKKTAPKRKPPEKAAPMDVKKMNKYAVMKERELAQSISKERADLLESLSFSVEKSKGGGYRVYFTDSKRDYIKVRTQTTGTKTIYGIPWPIKTAYYKTVGDVPKDLIEKHKEDILKTVEAKTLEVDHRPDKKDVPKFKIWSPDAKLFRAYFGEDYVQIKSSGRSGEYTLHGVDKETFDQTKDFIMEEVGLFDLKAYESPEEKKAKAIKAAPPFKVSRVDGEPRIDFDEGYISMRTVKDEGVYTLHGVPLKTFFAAEEAIKDKLGLTSLLPDPEVDLGPKHPALEAIKKKNKKKEKAAAKSSRPKTLKDYRVWEPPSKRKDNGTISRFIRLYVPDGGSDDYIQLNVRTGYHADRFGVDYMSRGYYKLSGNVTQKDFDKVYDEIMDEYSMEELKPSKY